MKLNLHVVSDYLEREFHLSTSRILSEYRFDNVKSYFGQDSLQEGTLYVLDGDDLARFLRQSEDRRCSLVIIGPYIEELPRLRPDLSFLSLEAERPNLLLEVLSSIQSCFDELQKWETRLASLRGRHYRLIRFLQVGYEVLQNPMLLYDDSYLIVASTQGFHEEPKDASWRALTAAGYWTPEIRSSVRAENHRFQRNRACYYDTNKFERNGTITVFYDQPRRLGVLFVMEYFHPITPGGLYLIQFFSDMLREELKEISPPLSENISAVDSFIRAVVHANINSFTDSFIDFNLMQLGWKNRGSYFCLVFCDMFSQENHQYVPEQVRNLFSDSYSLQMEDRLVTIVRAEEMEEITGPLAELVRDSVLKCGISTRLSSFSAVSYGYRQAVAALSIGELLDPTFWYYRFSDYSVEYALSFALETVSFETICHPAILLLVREDEENRSQYVDTLEMFLSGGKNLTKLAAAMHLHRNTLQYRLNRIAQIADINYADENEMKQLFFSIKLLRVYRGLYQKREHPADPPT